MNPNIIYSLLLLFYYLIAAVGFWILILNYIRSRHWGWLGLGMGALAIPVFYRWFGSAALSMIAGGASGGLASHVIMGLIFRGSIDLASALLTAFSAYNLLKKSGGRK